MPLHMAVNTGHLNCVKELLSAGAEKDAANHVRLYPHSHSNSYPHSHSYSHSNSYSYSNNHLKISFDYLTFAREFVKSPTRSLFMTILAKSYSII